MYLRMLTMDALLLPWFKPIFRSPFCISTGPDQSLEWLERCNSCLWPTLAGCLFVDCFDSWHKCYALSAVIPAFCFDCPPCKYSVGDGYLTSAETLISYRYTWYIAICLESTFNIGILL